MDVTRSGGVRRRRRRRRVRDPEISWEQCRPPPSAFRNGRVRADGGKDQILVSGSEKRRGGGNGCREGEEGSASPSPRESNLAICHVKHCSRSSFAKEWSAQEGIEGKGILFPSLPFVYGLWPMSFYCSLEDSGKCSWASIFVDERGECVSTFSFFLDGREG